jgi:hypothetical protein
MKITMERDIDRWLNEGGRDVDVPRREVDRVRATPRNESARESRSYLPSALNDRAA